MNYSTSVDDVEVWITLEDIKEAVEHFDDNSREELIDHLKECLVNHPKEIPCDEYQKTIDDVEVEVDVTMDDLYNSFGDEINKMATEGKIAIEAPTLAIQIEIEEALKDIFIKHGLSADNHVWGI